MSIYHSEKQVYVPVWTYFRVQLDIDIGDLIRNYNFQAEVQTASIKIPYYVSETDIWAVERKLQSTIDFLV